MTPTQADTALSYLQSIVRKPRGWEESDTADIHSCFTTLGWDKTLALLDGYFRPAQRIYVKGSYISDGSGAWIE